MKINVEEVFNNLPSAYAVLSPDSRICYLLATDAYLTMVDKTREELINNEMFEIFPDTQGTKPVILKVIERAIETKTTQKPPLIRYDLETSTRYWNNEFKPIMNNEGKVLYLIHALQDITSIVKLGLPAYEKQETSR